MTKVKILEKEGTYRKSNPIKAIACIQDINSGEGKDWIVLRDYDLKRYDNLEVIKVNNYHNFDCIIIADNTNVFLGYFNDGVVE